MKIAIYGFMKLTGRLLVPIIEVQHPSLGSNIPNSLERGHEHV